MTVLISAGIVMSDAIEGDGSIACDELMKLLVSTVRIVVDGKGTSTEEWKKNVVRGRYVTAGDYYDWDCLRFVH